jgi:hypothetical protein
MGGEGKVEKMKSKIEERFNLNILFMRLGTGINVVLYAIDAIMTEK